MPSFYGLVRSSTLLNIHVAHAMCTWAHVPVRKLTSSSNLRTDARTQAPKPTYLATHLPTYLPTDLPTYSTYLPSVGVVWMLVVLGLKCAAFSPSHPPSQPKIPYAHTAAKQIDKQTDRQTERQAGNMGDLIVRTGCFRAYPSTTITRNPKQY